MPHQKPPSDTSITHHWSFAVVLVAAVSIAAPHLSKAQASRQFPNPIAGILQSSVDDHVVAGAVVLVANKDKAIDIEAVGYADLAARTPMRTNNEFWIASMSKAMTGSALMMLVDEGKVKLDDPVEKYLPEFKGQMVRAVKPAKLRDPGEYHGTLVP
ncbi:MAG TPA: serine hydrolase domain-containing protein, partial [Acidobacteriaceae bacterium]